MKGIILAGGSGTRLYPTTKGVSKQLIPIYNKPMIYYPLTSLMLAGIRDILLISTPHDSESFQRLLGDGSWIGLNISYAVQESPDGIAQAFLIGKSFLNGSRAALALGDNIFFGHGLPEIFKKAAEREHGATVFGYQVKDPERYGVIAFDDNGNPTSIIEKPKNPPSSYAVTGIYFYDNRVVDFAETLKPSARGELEITDLNVLYLNDGSLYAEKMGRGFAWFDTGTFDSLMHASIYVQAIEERQGMMVACPEEIAYRQGFIGKEQLAELAHGLSKNSYGHYLMELLESD
ncbi:MAG: glucose-1-phosphate thymidylyltransferase [Candidatus Dadabacteria bacterium]|nr:MAG: glucose-1-phosphate thymidylyltransferase [Candidatus Dadabacteria bacterium]